MPYINFWIWPLAGPPYQLLYMGHTLSTLVYGTDLINSRIWDGKWLWIKLEKEGRPTWRSCFWVYASHTVTLSRCVKMCLERWEWLIDWFLSYGLWANALSYQLRCIRWHILDSGGGQDEGTGSSNIWTSAVLHYISPDLNRWDWDGMLGWMQL